MLTNPMFSMPVPKWPTEEIEIINENLDLTKTETNEFKGFGYATAIYTIVSELGQECDYKIIARRLKRLEGNEGESLQRSFQDKICGQYKATVEKLNKRTGQTESKVKTFFKIRGSIKTHLQHYIYEESDPNLFGERAIIVLERVKINK